MLYQVPTFSCIPDKWYYQDHVDVAPSTTSALVKYGDSAAMLNLGTRFKVPCGL